jgi:hypothetical protein
MDEIKSLPRLTATSIFLKAASDVQRSGRERAAAAQLLEGRPAEDELRRDGFRQPAEERRRRRGRHQRTRGRAAAQGRRIQGADFAKPFLPKFVDKARLGQIYVSNDDQLWL